MYFEELCHDLAAAAPPLPSVRQPTISADFEVELHRNLAALFGRQTIPG
jgi:hypothetical protein